MDGVLLPAERRPKTNQRANTLRLRHDGAFIDLAITSCFQNDPHYGGSLASDTL